MIKYSLPFLTITLLLSGCMTTSSGNKIAASKNTDGAMSCAEIVKELNEVNETIESIGTYENEVMATNIGTGIGGHAVSMAGVPLLGAMIGHAGGIANMNAAERQELKRDAEMRKNTLTGLYTGKGCR